MKRQAFDPREPFPLVSESEFSYPDAQVHAIEVDRWLGLQVDEVERGLAVEAGHQLWVGLGAQKLLTPYIELRMILQCLPLKGGERLVDLGAAYGRLGFVMAKHYPEVEFVGYELCGPRVAEGNRVLTHWQCAQARIELADLSASDFFPVLADYYFIYDFGTRQAIDKTLGDLKVVARYRPITVVGRGRASRDAIERGQPWLSGVVAPDHHAHFSVYRSR